MVTVSFIFIRTCPPPPAPRSKCIWKCWLSPYLNLFIDFCCPPKTGPPPKPAGITFNWFLSFSLFPSLSLSFPLHLFISLHPKTYCKELVGLMGHNVINPILYCTASPSAFYFVGQKCPLYLFGQLFSSSGSLALYHNKIFDINSMVRQNECTIEWLLVWYHGSQSKHGGLICRGFYWNLCRCL